jgi:hypothetical protein
MKWIFYLVIGSFLFKLIGPHGFWATTITCMALESFLKPIEPKPSSAAVAVRAPADSSNKKANP